MSMKDLSENIILELTFCLISLLKEDKCGYFHG